MKPAGEMMINCIISKPGQGGGLGGWEQREQVATPIYVNRLELIINKLLIKTNESFWLLFKLLFKLLFELLFKLLFELLLKL